MPGFGSASCAEASDREKLRKCLGVFAEKMQNLSRERAGEPQLASLWHAANGGEIDAQARLAWEFLGYPPYRLRDGLALAGSATKGGHSEAPYLLALYAALGVGSHQNWSHAIALLLLSAERGYTRAQAELAALAGRWDLAVKLAGNFPNAPKPATVIWKQLHDAVDIGVWLAAPKPKPVSSSPRIATVEAFASAE